MEKSLDSGEDSHNRQIGVLLRSFGDVVADGRAAIVATIQSASESKAAFGLIMGKTLGLVQLGQPTLDFGQEDEPLYRVIDRGVCRHGLQHLDDNTISRERLLHDPIVMQVIAPSLGQHPTLSISQIRPPAARKFEDRLLEPTN